MKAILRSVLINSLALFLASQIFRGLVITDPLQSVLLGGTVLTVMNLTIKPIFSLIALPFNLLTLGGFSWVVNGFIVYLLTVFVPAIKIENFTFGGATVVGIILPRVDFTVLTGIIAVSFVITFMTNFIKWLTS